MLFRSDRPVTMHPTGLQWVEPEFRDEPWFDFVGYQSGHNQKPTTLQWLIDGPPALQWDVEPRRPVINMEPCYEFLKPGAAPPNTAYDVRRAIYRSLLIHPTAGVTYGSDPIWVWNEEKMPALGHEELGPVEPWTTGLSAPGVEQMALMAQLFADLPWTELRPAQNLLPDQPQPLDPLRHVVAARTLDGKLAVAYLPTSDPVTLNLATMAGPIAEAHWFDPESGEMQPVEADLSAQRVKLAPPAAEAEAGAGDGASPNDWLLILRC